MKKLLISTMLFLISPVGAYAENPYVGQPEEMVRQDKAFRSAGSPNSTAVDYSATSLIGNSEANKVDPRATDLEMVHLPTYIAK